MKLGARTTHKTSRPKAEESSPRLGPKERIEKQGGELQLASLLIFWYAAYQTPN